jgi:hypothetical protein
MKLTVKGELGIAEILGNIFKSRGVVRACGSQMYWRGTVLVGKFGLDVTGTVDLRIN